MLGPENIAYEREGQGEPLLLMHGIGMSRQGWHPVLPYLREHRDVISIDLPGHGESPDVRADVVPAPPGYAPLLGRFLDELGIDRAHLAGNSLGGWTALELAKAGRARSVVALDPAGLWQRAGVLSLLRLLAMRRGAVRMKQVALRLARTRAGRRMLLRDTIGHPENVPAQDAEMLIRAIAEATRFEQTLVATNMRRFEGGQEIDVPVTVVFGTRERIISRKARRGDELPSHTRWLAPEGLGHVPMWDDPRGVAEILLAGSETASEGTAAVTASK